MFQEILLDYKTMRKCFGCKEYMTLEKELDNAVYVSKAFWHDTCYAEKLSKKKVGKLSEEDINKKMLELKLESEEHIRHTIIKNHLFKYLMFKYNVVLLPTYIFTKMEQIFKGEYRNMSSPIPPEHILDMFQRRQGYLDKIYHKEKMDGVSRINYDLAVLISKYNGYLEWIEKSKVENDTAEKKIEEDKPRMSYIFNKNVFTRNKPTEEDIFSDID
jgi:hypothetical protein